MNVPAIESDGGNVLREAPEGYEPTPVLAILLGDNDDKTLVQVWQHKHFASVWVSVPEWLLHHAGSACSLQVK